MAGAVPLIIDRRKEHTLFISMLFFICHFPASSATFMSCASSELSVRESTGKSLACHFNPPGCDRGGSVSWRKRRDPPWGKTGQASHNSPEWGKISANPDNKHPWHLSCSVYNVRSPVAALPGSSRLLCNLSSQLPLTNRKQTRFRADESEWPMADSSPDRHPLPLLLWDEHERGYRPRHM